MTKGDHLKQFPATGDRLMHRRGGRGGGFGETIKRRREREKATFWTLAFADPQSVQIVAAIRDREWFPASFTVANRCGAGVWIFVRVFSFSCFVCRVSMGSRRARSWLTDVQEVNTKVAVLTLPPRSCAWVWLAVFWSAYSRVLPECFSLPVETLTVAVYLGRCCMCWACCWSFFLVMRTLSSRP
jgi:hypothetical protein